jgi:hypothetical protein
MSAAWCERLLETHSLAVLSAAGVALLAFPGTDYARSATSTEGPIPADVAPSKGPEVRLTAFRTSSAPEARPVVVEEPSATPEPVKAEEREPPMQPQVRERAFDGCLQTHASAACRRAFEALVARERPADMRATVVASESFAPLAFEDRNPRWIRRIETLAEEGIAFKRLKQGPDRELVFGITPDGLLGFSLNERPH